MSVTQIRQCFSPPIKRARETISLASDGASKCAEIFVTNNADKWTFFCAYCEKATCDIGAFICHIRLEHLNGQTDLTQKHPTHELLSNVLTNTNSAATTQSTVVENELEIGVPQKSPQSKIIQEQLTICSKVSKITDMTTLELPESSEMENLIANKMPITTSNPLNYSQPEYFVITQLDEARHTESDTSCDSPRDNATHLESHEYKTKNTNTEIVENSKNQPGFQTKICKEYHKVFPTTKGLNIHIKSHDKKHLPCPLCPSKYKENLLITHILTHESDSCFPCQVCGAVYNSQDERLKHWKTHANEQPFDCKICYRRFTRKEYLTHHLKTHNQYRCNYCVCEFYTNEVLTEPYVCSKCDKMPHIKQTTSLHDQTSIVYDTDKSSINTSNCPHNINEEFFVLTATEKEVSQEQQQLNEEIAEIDVQDISYENILNNVSDTDDSDAVSCFSVSENNEKSASCSKPNTKKRRKTLRVEDTELPIHRCPYCKLGYKTKQAALQHILHNHDENFHQKLPWKCEECNRGFLTCSGLKVHLKSHNQNCHLECPVCSSKHNSNYFITHVMTHESDTCFPCQVCGKLYSSHKERMQHWEIHSEEKPFDCNICYRRFRKQQYLTHHLKTHKNEQLKHRRSLYEKTLTTLATPLDEVTAKHIEEFITNKQSSLGNDESSDAPNSGSNAPASFSLNEEIDSDDTFSYENDSNLEFIDETCDDVDNDDNVPSGSGHKNSPAHSQTTQFEGVHNCLYCARVFINRRALSTHTKRTHINKTFTNRPYKCSYCSKDFKTKSSLTFHEKTHDKNKYEFKCPLCPLTSFREGDFIAHVLLHESESCYPCQVCAKICYTSEERLAHWATHVNERPFGCEFCYRRFAQKHVLYRHLKSHQQLKHIVK